MNNKVFVGNLPWSTSAEDLEAMLRDMGYTLHSVKVIMDRETGKSRGFAFVEFYTPEAAAEAIKNLDTYVLEGRPLRFSEANERTGRPGGGGGSRGGGGGSNEDRFREERDGNGHDRRGHRDRRDLRENSDW